MTINAVFELYVRVQRRVKKIIPKTKRVAFFDKFQGFPFSSFFFTILFVDNNMSKKVDLLLDEPCPELLCGLCSGKLKSNYRMVVSKK